MEEPWRVLVLPAGTNIGLEIRDSLALSKHWTLIGANSTSDHSEVCYSNWIGGLPHVSDPHFVTAVRDIAIHNSVNFVIPAHDEAAYLLAGEDLGGAIFVGPQPQLASILRFKSKTYEALRDCVQCPQVYSVADVRAADLPLFAKPDRGQGSRGARFIRSIEELELARREPNLLFSEILPGDEFTIDCFTDKMGQLKYCGGRVRARIANGISVRAEAVSDPRLSEMAARISDALRLRGAWFFQVKLDARGAPTVLEVANRVSGTMGYQRERGINLVEAWLQDLRGSDISFIHWTFGPVVYDRALAARIVWDYRPEAVYVDLDDTLVFPNGKLNYSLIGALYGLRFNIGARLILVTRHRLDIGDTLERLALSSLFHEIRHLTQNEPKSSVIAHERAIFIDDSFTERREVHARHGIPTFPIEAMACIDGLNHAALG